MTTKFNLAAHKKLWDWLARNPNKEKSEWSEWDLNVGVYASYLQCFACDYAIFQRSGMHCKCDFCPLDWGKRKRCIDSQSTYIKWEKSTDLEQRRKLAEQIRDLPVKDGVECE